MEFERITLYTWQDVENYLYMDRPGWPNEWKDIDVYNTGIVIYTQEINDRVKSKSNEYLKELLRQYYSNGKVRIPITDTTMEIVWEETDEEIEPKQPFPLFKDFLYVTDENNIDLPELKGAPVMAFHSYKGGVGRTLSLITFVRNMIDEYGSAKKVLIVDGDMEAPGLTWLGEEQNGKYPISYIDFLNIINSKGIDDKIFEQISYVLENSQLTFHNSKMSVSQYFMPTYRLKDQLLNIYSNPERIMSGEKNKYIITDALSHIGHLLKADMVLVDLRAGISEYSAPFLFDPRVKKVIVSSTSKQSVVGTDLLLQQLKKQKNNMIYSIVLTKVIKEVFTGKVKDEVYHTFIEDSHEIENDEIENDIKNNTIIEVPHNPLLIHLGNLEHTCDVLNKVPDVTDSLMNITKEAFAYLEEGKIVYTKEQIKEFQRNLYEITNYDVTAEGSDTANMLVTKPVMQLASFTRDIPKINILGAKGSGKTYLYKQLVCSKTWNNFLKILGKADLSEEETLICPVLCSEYRAQLQQILSECHRNLCEKLPIMRRKTDWLSKNESVIRDAIEQKFSENDWQNLWDNLIWGMFDGITSWEKLETYLRENKKRVIFIFDGIETLFSDFMQANTEKKAIKSLCKGFVNRLYEQQTEQIGTIVFVRKDIAELAIDVNFEQFRNQYQQYELNWLQKDALQLAWKLSERAAKICGLSITEDNTPIYNLTPEVIDKNLSKVWGKKMGPDGSKTAGTIRWVLASLSDFNGQLQARDIVRFLKFASSENNDSKNEYYDRLLSPDPMKKAIKLCSEQKLKEVEDEIHQLKKSFQILKEMPTHIKQVPLLDEVLDKLSNEERKTLERYGYLKEADGEYYIPESIRYALGYNKTRRGGIKIVSLLVNQ